MDKIGAERELPKPRRLGKINPANKYNRAILLEYTRKSDIDDIMGKAKLLADVSEESPLSNIYIQRDLPPSVREANYKLRKQLKEEKTKEENTGANLKIDYRAGTIRRTVVDEEVVIYTVKHPF